MAETRRILLADDNADVQDAVQRVAERDGYRIIRVTSGLDVHELTAATQPDLVVLDMQFPDADGRDILSRLKSDPRTAKIPVLVWSGRDAESDRRISLSLGAEDYVEKEGAFTLLRKIERVLLRLSEE